MSLPWVVVKVGGSLYDLPDLRERLTAWMARFDAVTILLVPGGGLTAEAIRAFDKVHKLGEEAAHWLAIRALSVNARLLQEFFPQAQLLMTLPGYPPSSVNILDPYPFFRADEQRDDHLPHLWQVTSDSLALRTAWLLKAKELILLKSLDWKGGDWGEAAQADVVDGYFPIERRKAPAALQIRVVNLRSWTQS